MSALAEVLAAHYMSLGVQGGWYCLCGEQVAHFSDVSTHVADALTKAGYGKLADAWDEGHQSGFWNGRESSGNTEGLLIGAEHADAMNPYRSAS